MLFLSPSLQLSCRCFCCHGLPCCYHCSFVAALKGNSNTTKTNKTLLCACKLPQTTLTCFVAVYKAQKEKVSYREQTEPSQATMTSSSPSSWCLSQLYDATAFVRSLRPRVQLLPEHYYSPDCDAAKPTCGCTRLESTGTPSTVIYAIQHCTECIALSLPLSAFPYLLSFQVVPIVYCRCCRQNEIALRIYGLVMVPRTLKPAFI